jgi:hypothetical protein
MVGVSDDFRVTVDLVDDGGVADFVDEMQSIEVEQEVAEKLGNRVIVSHDADNLFFYTDTEDGAREVETLVKPLLDQHGLGDSTIRILRWHPIEEDWLDVSAPMPTTPDEIAAERAKQEAEEAEESREQGWAEFEVRAELPSHRATVEFAKQLEAEGYAVVRRWKFLVIAANTEDEATALAEKLRAEAPEGTKVLAEGSGNLAWQAGGGGRFAWLGGMGG